MTAVLAVNRARGRIALSCAVTTALIVLASCNHGLPKVCKTDPKGFACRDWHRMKAYRDRAEHERKMMSGGIKPLKMKPLKARSRPANTSE